MWIAKAVFLGLALAFASHTGAATIVVKVSALIDGRDQLILQGNTLQWHHFDFAAVGRHEGRDEPTLISTTVDGVPVIPQTSWTPVWSTPPPDELYSINTFSSVFDQLNPSVPRESSTTSLNILSGYSTVIVQSPSASNGFTTIVEFNDNPLVSSQQYTVEIVYRTVPELSSAGVILLGGAGIGSVFRRKTKITSTVTSLCVVGCSLAVLFLSSTRAAIVYDAASQFSSTNNSESSIWSYRYSPGTSRDGFYSLLPEFGPADGGWSPSIPGAWTLNHTVPELGVNQTGTDVTYINGPAFVWLSNTILHHAFPLGVDQFRDAFRRETLVERFCTLLQLVVHLRGGEWNDSVEVNRLFRVDAEFEKGVGYCVGPLDEESGELKSIRQWRRGVAIRNRVPEAEPGAIFVRQGGRGISSSALANSLVRY
jgi:hypothetical protein